MEDIQWSGGNSDGFMTANAVRFCSDLQTKCQLLSHVKSKTWHGLAPMVQQEPASHCNTTYEANMEHIQWSGGNSDGFKTADAMSFGSD
jgi:hypothetical protein